MTDSKELFQKTLKNSGQSLTKSRQVVFKSLQGQEPQTMQAVVKACKGKVDRASVYRNIALFERLGIVQRLQIGWKYKLELSDKFHHHHHHLTCLQCGRTFTLEEDQQLETQLRLLAARHRFKMRGHQLEIHGLCQNCAATPA